MKRALGIDLGEARIGVAVSDELGMLAHALETIVVKETRDPIARIVQLATEKDVGSRRTTRSRCRDSRSSCARRAECWLP